MAEGTSKGSCSPDSCHTSNLNRQVDGSIIRRLTISRACIRQTYRARLLIIASQHRIQTSHGSALVTNPLATTLLPLVHCDRRPLDILRPVQNLRQKIDSAVSMVIVDFSRRMDDAVFPFWMQFAPVLLRRKEVFPRGDRSAFEPGSEIW